MSALKVVLGACVALPLASSLALAQPGPPPGNDGPGRDGPGHDGPGMHRPPPPPPHRHWHWRNHHRVYY